MKNYLVIILLLGISMKAIAQNPIVPPGIYIADPSAKIWNDGKLYIYGSLDESTDYYCSWRHHVMETDDLKDWKITENVFSSKGLRQPWTKHVAWVNIPGNDTGEWQTITADIKKTQGVHALWLTFYGKDKDMFVLNWLRFE